LIELSQIHDQEQEIAMKKESGTLEASENTAETRCGRVPDTFFNPWGRTTISTKGMRSVVFLNKKCRVRYLRDDGAKRGSEWKPEFQQESAGSSGTRETSDTARILTNSATKNPDLNLNVV